MYPIIGNYYSFSQLSGNEKCLICLQSLGDQEYIGKLECGHNFCFECISNWSKSSSTCCTCRQSIHSIYKITRMDITKALEFQEDQKFKYLNKPVLRTSIYPQTIIPIPSCFSYLSSINKNENEVGILTNICYVKRQIQRISTDGDEIYASQVFFHENNIELMNECQTDEVCDDCQKPGLLLICDGCNSNHHLDCQSPKLTSIPDGLWICNNCEIEKNQLNYSNSEFINDRQQKQSLRLATSTSTINLDLVENEKDKKEDALPRKRKSSNRDIRKKK